MPAKRDGFAERARAAALAQSALCFGDASRARIIVALSGGPDSSALLLALHHALPNALIGAAHFHHGLRGADADADVSFCAGLCANLGVPLAVALGKVTPAGRSPQDAARRDRYDFLQETAWRSDANAIAVAHTADDQAETVLGRVLRGTSVDGLAGIPATRELSPGLFVLRPLLGLTRAEGEAFCGDCEITPRQDPSNVRDKYARSRLRKRMPDLARDFNPRLADALCRLADNARTDSDLLGSLAGALYREAVIETVPGTSVRARRTVLLAAHAALRRRVLLRVIAAVYPSAAVVPREEATTATFVGRIEAMLISGTGAVNLPGNVSARLTDKRTVLTIRAAQEPPPHTAK